MIIQDYDFLLFEVRKRVDFRLDPNGIDGELTPARSINIGKTVSLVVIPSSSRELFIVKVVWVGCSSGWNV